MVRLALMALTATLIAGCGTGTGGAGAIVQQNPVTLEVSLQGASATTVVYAVELVLRLPAGVSLISDAVTGAVSVDQLQTADGNALAGARYTPASGSDPARLKLEVADPQGFTVGPLATLTCLASGAAPDAAQFEIESFGAKDDNGAPLSGVAPELTVRSR